MDFQYRSILRLTCARGQSEWLRAELEALSYATLATEPSGVEVEGSMRDAMDLNLRSRIAMRVLYRLDERECQTKSQLERMVESVAWEDIISEDGHLTVTSTVDHPSISNSMFANVLVKDAIVDRIRAARGRRPDSGPRPIGVVVHLHWHRNRASLWLDTSGDKLADRGYRRMPHKAPLRETLAAAILRRSGYTGTSPLVIPMCGSGTLAIEGALMATQRPPGLLRRSFAFMHVLGFDADAFSELRREVAPRRGRRSKIDVPAIIATDIDPAAIEATRRNAETAGVAHLIETEVCDFAATNLPDDPGHIILHPEYGLRLGEEAELKDTYARMGDFFKKQCAGWSAWIFTGNLELAKSVGLRAACRVPFRNADVDARLLGYELWQGRRTASKASP